MQVICIGDARIEAFPGEMFAMYGLRVRERLAPAYVLIACYADDYIGYFTTPDAETGYEVDSAIVAPPAGQLLVDVAVRGYIL